MDIQFHGLVSSVLIESLFYLHRAFPTAGPDQETYFSNLIFYLSNLHMGLEQWSGMNIDINSVLVRFGGFHLLLKELHTAPTAPVSGKNG